MRSSLKKYYYYYYYQFFIHAILSAKLKYKKLIQNYIRNK